MSSSALLPSSARSPPVRRRTRIRPGRQRRDDLRIQRHRRSLRSVRGRGTPTAHEETRSTRGTRTAARRFTRPPDCPKSRTKLAGPLRSTFPERSGYNHLRSSPLAVTLTAGSEGNCSELNWSISRRFGTTFPRRSFAELLATRRLTKARRTRRGQPCGGADSPENQRGVPICRSLIARLVAVLTVRVRNSEALLGRACPRCGDRLSGRPRNLFTPTAPFRRPRGSSPAARTKNRANVESGNDSRTGARHDLRGDDQAAREYYGSGPTKAKTYMDDDFGFDHARRDSSPRFRQTLDRQRSRWESGAFDVASSEAARPVRSTVGRTSQARPSSSLKRAPTSMTSSPKTTRPGCRSWTVATLPRPD